MTPTPGLHRLVPFADYCAWPALNSSIVRSGETEREWRHYMRNPRPESGAMRLGRLLHTRILETELYHAMSLVPVESVTHAWGTRQSTRQLREGCDADTWPVADEQCGGIAVCPEWPQLIEDMVGLVHANEEAKKLLDAAPMDRRELSIAWEHTGTGLLCKARVDALARVDGRWMLVDLKTTARAGRHFDRFAIDHGYHIQMAHYAAAVVAVDPEVTYEDLDCAWIVVDKSGPMDCEVVVATDGLRMAARQLWVPLMHRYANAVVADKWPGRFDSWQNARTLDVPAWMEVRNG